MKKNTKTALQVMGILFIGIPSWLGLTFVFFQFARKLQIFLFQKPGETLYATGYLIVGILLVVFFVPLAIYDLITKIFFPQRHEKEMEQGAEVYTRKGLEIVEKVLIIAAIMSIFLFIICFNMYLSLGKDYVVYSPFGLSSHRNYYTYSDIKAIKYKDDRENNWRYRYFLKDRKIAVDFWQDVKLIRDITAHQSQLGLEEKYTVEDSPEPNKIRRSISRLVSPIIMWGGLALVMSLLMKKKKRK